VINRPADPLPGKAQCPHDGYARTLIVARVLAEHRPGEVAKQLGISRQTVYKWMRRLRAEGVTGLADRSSRPHRLPRRTSPRTTAAIVAARVRHHAGPVRLAAILGLPASTVAAVLARAGLPRLAEFDRLTGERLAGGGTATAATSAPTPVTCCTSTSRSSAGYPTAAAGACTAAARKSVAAATAGTTCR
jgi:transposase